MWIDDQKIAHTVAPPDWRTVIRVAEQELTAVPDDFEDALEDCRAEVYRSIETGALGPGGPAQELPAAPVDVPAGVFTDADALRDFVNGVEAWWRLDVIEALDECAEELAS